MAGNCCGEGVVFEGMSVAYRRTLWTVILINASMFIVEIFAGFTAGSMALQADALDFLGDTATYAISLWVLGKSIKMRASAALFKGATLAIMGVSVLGATLYQTFAVGQPEPFVMSSVGIVAFFANVISALLLYRFRDGDSNVRSVWLCSRNDAIGNIAVVAAAGVVWWTGSGWPDLIVAAAMASLFLWSAFQIIRQALGELQQIDRPEGIGDSASV